VGARRAIAAYPTEKSSRIRPRPRKASGTTVAFPRAKADGTTTVTTVNGAAAARAKNTSAGTPRRPAAREDVAGGGTAPLTPGDQAFDNLR